MWICEEGESDGALYEEFTLRVGWLIKYEYGYSITVYVLYTR